MLPIAIAILGAAELFSLKTEGWGYGIALEVAACLMLIARRHFTFIACTLAAAFIFAMPWVGPELNEPAAPILAIAVIAYSLGRRLDIPVGLLGMSLMGLMVGLDYALIDSRDQNVSDAVFVMALLAPPYVLGRLARKLATQSEQLLRQQEWMRHEAARAERHRIARDLHDVIAHSLSAMVVQTAAAQDLVRTDPARAEAVLKDVADAGRRAISETGRLLLVLRDKDDGLGLTPAPGLADIPALLESFRSSGLSVDFHADEPAKPLPGGLELSLFRILEELLTNALKHAADRAILLRVCFTTSDLSVHTENRAGRNNVGGSGLGLVGMAERVSVFGGSLSHQLTEDGRFLLDVTMPLNYGGGQV